MSDLTGPVIFGGINLGLTLIWRNERQSKSSESILCLEEKPIINNMSNSSHLLGPDPKLFMCVCGCVGTQPVCTESWMTEEYDACVSIYFCVIACDLGLCLLQIVAES